MNSDCFISEYEDPALRISSLSGSSNRLVISFSGIGPDLSDWPPQEFISSAHQNGRNHVLFVMDRERSWMNAPGMIGSLLATIVGYQSLHGITQTSAIGHSMGAFNALTLARLMPLQSVLAFNPQYSTHPEYVKHKTIWEEFRQKIQTYLFVKVDHFPDHPTKYIIIHGNRKIDAAHWPRFPFAHNLWHFVIEKAWHSYPERLKRNRDLNGFVSAVLDQNMDEVLNFMSREGALMRSQRDGNIDEIDFGSACVATRMKTEERI